MKKLRIIFKYISWLFKARDEHAVHSPFLYDFYTNVIKRKEPKKEFDNIEKIRQELSNSKREIEILDLGAGSGIDSSRTRTIGSICRNSEKAPFLAQILFRIIRYQKPATMIDLGTSLGITTLYEAMAHPGGKVYTFEGCPQTMNIARENFERMDCHNIIPVTGNIDDTLQEQLNNISSADFVFFDANHRYEPTMRYFRACLKKAHENSVFVFDDIYWSSGMEKAWNEIKQDPATGISIDLFYIGIIFFRKKQPVQHFTLRSR